MIRDLESRCLGLGIRVGVSRIGVCEPHAGRLSSPGALYLPVLEQL